MSVMSIIAWAIGAGVLLVVLAFAVLIAVITLVGTVEWLVHRYQDGLALIRRLRALKEKTGG